MCKREKGLYVPWMLVTDVCFISSSIVGRNLVIALCKYHCTVKLFACKKCQEILFW